MGGSSIINFGVPTLDRPFGLELWPIFEAVFEPIVGYKPQDFRFVPGETPLSTFKVCAVTLLTYYVIIFGGRELMRNREPFKLNFLFKVHNFYLTAISGILLALFVEQLLPIVVRKGLFFAICDHQGGWTDKLVILYYLNYLTKFVELIDTCFLFLKKKPLSTFTYKQRAKHKLTLHSLPPHLPPRRDRPSLLHPAHRTHSRLMARHYPQLGCPRGHVLVLLPERARHPNLVEEVHHRWTNLAIRP
jgi:fatty acid elongase 3